MMESSGLAQGVVMSVLYVVGIVVAVALVAYLFFAMLKPERFE